MLIKNNVSGCVGETRQSAGTVVDRIRSSEQRPMSEIGTTLEADFSAVPSPSRTAGSADAPLPESEGGLLVERVRGVLQGPADLAPVVRLVGDQVAEEGRSRVA